MLDEPTKTTPPGGGGALASAAEKALSSASHGSPAVPVPGAAQLPPVRPSARASSSARRELLPRPLDGGRIRLLAGWGMGRASGSAARHCRRWTGASLPPGSSWRRRPRPGGGHAPASALRPPDATLRPRYATLPPRAGLL